jgi:hypothetical protein
MFNPFPMAAPIRRAGKNTGASYVAAISRINCAGIPMPPAVIYLAILRWIAGQDEASLAGDLVYRNLSGAGFRNRLTPTLLHVFNHGTLPAA